MDDSISQKVAFLIEMFEDLSTDFIEHLVSQHPQYTLEQLVNECLTQNERTHSHSASQTTSNHSEFAEMISLIPASTTSYFNTNSNHNHTIQTTTDSKQTDHKNDDTLNTLPAAYKTFVERYSNHKDIVKLVDIHTHLSLMTEQYKLRHDKYELQPLHACIRMIHKLMHNIHKSPTIDKYRCIRESNKAFQKKIAHIQGSNLLLTMCGWDHIGNTNHNSNDGMYIFNSALNTSWIEMVARFLSFYIEQETQHNKTQQNSFDIITEFRRKKLKPKNVKLGKKTRVFPKINRLSKQQLREKRLRNLGNVEDEHYGTVVNNGNSNTIGPIADGIMDLNAPNLRNELMQIAKKKHRKWINSRKARQRVFTMKDIERLRKEEFDRKAKGPKVSNALDVIGKEALKWTNEFRKQHGLSELKWHQDLCNIGRVHSQNMSEGKVPFGHDGFNDRVQQYPFRVLSAAENVAMSQGMSDVARVAVDGWIQSPGHRKNLLSNHNYCGIGVYRGYNGAYYLTQLFGLTNI
eukprot:692204_1